MIRNRFGQLRRWIEAQSTIGRIGVLIAAVVLFVIAQQFAGVSNAAESGSAALEALAGLVALVLVIVAIYAVYAVARSFIGRDSSGDHEA